MNNVALLRGGPMDGKLLEYMGGRKIEFPGFPPLVNHVYWMASPWDYRIYTGIDLFTYEGATPFPLNA